MNLPNGDTYPTNSVIKLACYEAVLSTYGNAAQHSAVLREAKELHEWVTENPTVINLATR